MGTASIVLLADMWGSDDHMGGGWWIVMMLWMVLFWGAVVFGIVWLVRRGTSQPRHEPPHEPRRETPLDVLDRRFAEGSMSADEYRERRDVLTGRSQA